MKRFFLVLIALCFAATSYGQLPPPTVVLEVGAGANTYQGELNSFADKWDASFYAAGRFQKWDRFHPGLAVSFGQAIGQDFAFEIEADTIFPNQSFQTDFFAVFADMQFNIIKKENFKLYLSQGFGLLRFTPKGTNGEDLLLVEDTRFPDETYNEQAITLPSGVGAAYSFKNGFGVGTTLTLYNPFSAYLDNISRIGPDPDTNDNLGEIRFYLQIPLMFEQKSF